MKINQVTGVNAFHTNMWRCASSTSVNALRYASCVHMSRKKFNSFHVMDM